MADRILALHHVRRFREKEVTLAQVQEPHQRTLRKEVNLDRKNLNHAPILDLDQNQEIEMLVTTSKVIKTSHKSYGIDKINGKATITITTKDLIITEADEEVEVAEGEEDSIETKATTIETEIKEITIETEEITTEETVTTTITETEIPQEMANRVCKTTK